MAKISARGAVEALRVENERGTRQYLMTVGKGGKIRVLGKVKYSDGWGEWKEVKKDQQFAMTPEVYLSETFWERFGFHKVS